MSHAIQTINCTRALSSFQCVRTSAETLDQWEVSGRCWWQQLLNASSVCFRSFRLHFFFLDKFDRFYTVAIRVIGPRLIFFFLFFPPSLSHPTVSFSCVQWFAFVSLHLLLVTPYLAAADAFFLWVFVLLLRRLSFEITGFRIVLSYLFRRKRFFG